ncbi:MAG: Glu-tRNA(Gln) amidotransferase subunit GatD [Thermoplasmataceae archaeon]
MILSGGYSTLKNLAEGTILRFKYKQTQFDGVVISSTNGTVNVKLNSGYNITIPVDSMDDVELRGTRKIVNAEARQGVPHGGKRVGLLATGGTIASRVDYVTGAVKPVLDPAFLEDSVSNIRDFSLDMDLMEPVLSENLAPADWVEIAHRVMRLLEKDQRCIVLHGTDTMSYTASALSFMFEEQTGPVLFVGSQRSSDRPSSDAFLNLEASLEFSVTSMGEVGIVMHRNISDHEAALHRAVRSRKMHTSRRDAFRTLGGVPMAVYSSGTVRFNEAPRTASDRIVLKDRLERKVSMVYFHPSLEADDLGQMLNGRRAAIIMGTGLGHVGNRFYGTIKDAVNSGVKVIMTSQCINGMVDMNVYSTGRELQSIGVIPAGSMLPEVAMVKSMYLLGNYPEEDFTKLFLQNLRGEFNLRDGMGDGPI